MRIQSAGLAIVACLGLVSPAGAIVPGESGAHARYWDDHAVVVARVAEVLRPDADAGMPPSVRLDVTAVLATDIPVATRLRVAHEAAVGDSPLGELRAGDMIVACLGRRRRDQDVVPWEFPRAVVYFLNVESSVRRITSPDDPAIAEVIDRLRLARDAARDRARQPTTRRAPTGVVPAPEPPRR
jgi:hypothetical protein